MEACLLTLNSVNSLVITQNRDLWRNLYRSLPYFVVRVQCGKESSRSLSHLLMSFLLFSLRCHRLPPGWCHYRRSASPLMTGYWLLATIVLTSSLHIIIIIISSSDSSSSSFRLTISDSLMTRFTLLKFNIAEVNAIIHH